MAKPDLDDGWVKLAHELLAAVFIADFSKRCMVVLREVFEQAYGPQKRRDVWLDPLDISRRSGLRRENVWHAIGDLVEDGVLTKNPDGSHRFVKDYERWTRKGADRLSRPERLYARAAQDRAAGPSRRPSKASQKDISARVSIDTRACLDRHTAPPPRVSIETHCNPSARVSIDTPHIEERAEERIEKGELRTVAAPRRQHAGARETPEAGAAGREGIDLAPIREKARRLFGEPYAVWVDRIARDWPADWVDYALDETAAAGSDRPAYTLEVLRTLKAGGGPPRPEARPAANGKHAAIDRMAGWVPPSLRKEKP